ncbi:MAG TPA: hypothetical protein VI413_13405 [Paludibacter sp.]
MKNCLVILLLIHGLIHLLGFVKAFQLAPVEQLQSPVSKPAGICWLFAFLLFATAAVTDFLKIGWWNLPAIAAVILSTTLIIGVWKDAKFGTIANLIILLFLL